MKFLHASDTHIKLLKEHDSYKTVFEQIYSIAKEQKVDAIVHTGDLFHTKIQLTPEAISMASDFLRSLADIAPLYIIPGNHDTNLKNNKRLDSISPIVDALNHKDIHYLKSSGETVINENITLNVMSLLDQENWGKPSDSNKINIALLHGSVAGVQTDIGYVMEHGEFTVDIFEGHDYAMCGDIHMSNQGIDQAEEITIEVDEDKLDDYIKRGWEIIKE